MFRANPKALYGYMRDKSKSKQKISQLITPDGTPTTSDGEVAEVLNNFFQSAFIIKSDTIQISHSSVNQQSEVFITESEVFITESEVFITESEVYESLSSLKPNKAPRPDNLHPQVFFTTLC